MTYHMCVQNVTKDIVGKIHCADTSVWNVDWNPSMHVQLVDACSNINIRW